MILKWRRNHNRVDIRREEPLEVVERAQVELPGNALYLLEVDVIQRSD
jgi:hypothetical protein